MSWGSCPNLSSQRYKPAFLTCNLFNRDILLETEKVVSDEFAELSKFYTPYK